MTFLLRDHYVAVNLTRSASKKHATILKLIRNLDVDHYISDSEIVSLAEDRSGWGKESVTRNETSVND
jgi:hypothetical protein